MQRSDLLRGVPEQIAALREKFPGRELVCVYRQGGYGDKLVLVAYARALERSLLEHCKRDDFVLVIATNTYADSEVANAIFAHQGLDAVITTQSGIEWQRGCLALREHFDLFYDLQYLVGVYAKTSSRFYARALQNLQELKPFASYYAEFPKSNWFLGEHYAVSQFDLMSWTGGVEVSPKDLHFELPIDESEKLQYIRSLGKLERYGYVTLHAGQGGTGDVKVPEMRAFARMAEELEARGLMAVQIGHARDKEIPGAFDARGLFLTESAQLMKQALFHIDCEGFLPILARAIDTRALVFFGSTPTTMFHFDAEPEGFPGHFGYTNLQCRPCWWQGASWPNSCQQGHRCCINLPSPAEAAAAVEKVITIQQKWLLDTLKQSVPHLKERSTMCREFAAARISKDYSQWGEQRQVLEYFGSKSVSKIEKPPRFLDLGAFDGVTGSNTFALAQLGWEGVSVEASPRNFDALLRTLMPFQRVSALNAAISPVGGIIPLYDALGQITTCFTEHHIAQWVKQQYFVAGVTGEQIAAQFGGRFEFVSIDIEGMEEQVIPTLGPVLGETKLICFEDRLPNCNVDEAYFQRLLAQFAAFGFTKIYYRTKPGTPKTEPSGNTFLVRG